MATYVVGDVHGCFDTLMELLDRLSFHPRHDTLHLVGDLVNRGPRSLDTLRWVMTTPNVHTVLGNHDLHALALAFNALPSGKAHHMDDLLTAPERDWVDWLRHQPLMRHLPTHCTTLVHAGLFPGWTLDEAAHHARTLEAGLQGHAPGPFLQSLYGNEPTRWCPNGTDAAQRVFITNALTRMRYVAGSAETGYTLNLDQTGPPGSQAPGLQPWFALAKLPADHTLCFGHWSALQAKVDTPQLQGLDGGCVWGEQLVALRLEDRQRFHVTNHNPCATP